MQRVLKGGNMIVYKQTMLISGAFVIVGKFNKYIKSVYIGILFN